METRMTRKPRLFTALRDRVDPQLWLGVAVCLGLMLLLRNQRV